ncbi:MAG: hypothetical protein HZB16_07065 [Armatimonadetes bacterium]|nr:hypothetical protein [Armatimonadota bacterium]
MCAMPVRSMLLSVCLLSLLTTACVAQQTVCQFDLSHGLPGGWKKGVLVSQGLPAGSLGAVKAEGNGDIQVQDNWVDGHFAVADDLYLNYRCTLARPEWYQVFIFCKARGTAADQMTLYEAKAPVDASFANQWKVVSLPLSSFVGTNGPGQGKAPIAGTVCWSMFFSFQNRDLGMVVDQLWVSRGKPASLPGGGSLLPVAADQTAMAGPSAGWPEKGTWAFQPSPDTFSTEARFDLRTLNERAAGEFGFVKLSPDGNDLLLGDGRPARFWAVNTSANTKHPLKPAPDLARHARFLAKRGINMVRFHGNLTPAKDGALTDIDRGERDGLWRMVAAMKKEGIYTTFSPYWAVSSRVSPAMGVPEAGKGGNFGLLFFNATLQNAYKAWMKQALTEPNPYTGIPLAKDPALAIIQLQNEDSLLFWTSQNIEGAAGAELRRRFAAFATRKYGGLTQALAAWPQAGLKDDAPTTGELGFYPVWELTQDRGGAGQKQRCADQMQFFTETMRGFNQQMADYLRRELGCGQLVNAGNWRTADEVKMLDAERYSYTANEVLAVNRYYTGQHQGANNGWAIVNGDKFTDDSVLLRPRDLPVSLKQVEGHPIMVTESSWVPPLGYQSEGPFLVAAYQSLNGVDTYFWFATSEEAWREPGSANGYMPSEGKWVCATPMLMGQWPAAALMYRLGYVKQAQPAVVEQRALTDLWQRRTPLIAEDPGFDPNRDAGNRAPKANIAGGVSPLAFLAGPVVARYDATHPGRRAPRAFSPRPGRSSWVTWRSSAPTTTPRCWRLPWTTSRWPPRRGCWCRWAPWNAPPAGPHGRTRCRTVARRAPAKRWSASARPRGASAKPT